MSVRRSVRLNPACALNLNSKKVDENSEEIMQENKEQLEQEDQTEKAPQEKNINNSKAQKTSQEEETEKDHEVIQIKEEMDIEIVEESSANVNSATVKALNKMKLNAGQKKREKKNVKAPMAYKRKMLNKRLSKLLIPKSALILLHELKPNCIFKFEEQTGSFPPSFCAQVIYEDEIIGTGQGLSKSVAKNSAAENAIKSIVSKTIINRSNNTNKDNKSVKIDVDEEEDVSENLPWAGLASFAIYKMFNEWQAQGTDLLTRPYGKSKTKSSIPFNAPTKKDLPSNATELHPAVVLNMVCPGLTAVEVEREDGPKCRVKMAYTIGGKTFTGVGGNKKDAKKEAAKAVLEGLYGLSYSQ